jgi:DNA polymerase phi
VVVDGTSFVLRRDMHLSEIATLESLFSRTSSPERKYWGFQVFQKALARVTLADMPILFTKNFMRSWINHLSQHDRYLHKVAKQLVCILHVTQDTR